MKNNEVGVTRGTHVREKRYRRGFGEQTWGQETIWKS